MSTGAHRGRRVLLTLAGLLFALVPAGGVGASPVAAQGGPHAEPQPSAPTLSDMLAKDPAATWYAIGDSYISGEGTFSYYGDSNNKKTDDYCHRSPQSYAALMGIPESHFLACSGATIDNIGWTGHQGEHAQVPRVPASARVVLVSAGGDSLDFKDVIQDCLDIPVVQHLVGKQGCQDKVSSETSPVTNGSYNGCKSVKGSLIPDWPTTGGPRDQLVCLLREVNHFAPKAKIVVVGYPRLFPAHPAGSCSTISVANQELLNQADNTLDTGLDKWAVDHASKLGMRASFVSSTWDAWSGNEMCQSLNPDINELTLVPAHIGCHVPPGILPVANAQLGPCVESIHPTVAGYRAMEPLVWSAADSLFPQVCAASPCGGPGQNEPELKVTGITSDTSTVDGATYRVLAITIWVDDPPSRYGGSDILFGDSFAGIGVSLVDSQHTSVNWWDNAFPFAGKAVQEADGRTCFSGDGGGYTVLPGETLTVPLDYCFLARASISYPILQLTVAGEIFTPYLLTT